MSESGSSAHKPLFSQTFLGAVVVTVVGGVLVWVVTNSLSKRPEATSSPPTISSESESLARPTAPVALSTPPSGSAPVQNPLPAQPPSGAFAYGRPIGELRVRGYGQEQVGLVLESIENRPSTILTLHFLLDNKGHAPYQISLLDPDNSTFVTDAQGAEHSYRSVTKISEIEPLMLAAFSRHRFSISFTPLVDSGDTIAFRATFNIAGKGHFPSKEVIKVEADSIRLSRPIQEDR